MLKGILKKTFPIVFLKNIYLYLNIFKIKFVDIFIYRKIEVHPSLFLLKTIDKPFESEKFKISNSANLYDKYLLKWNSWEHDVFVLNFDEPVFIDPNYGWAIKYPNQLLYNSLSYSYVNYLPKPSILKLVKNKNEALQLEKCISIRDTGEENYFHFYNEVIPKLFQLEEYGLCLSEIPIVISEKLFTKHYFQFFLINTDLFKGFNWVIQGTQYIKSNQTYFCKPLTHQKKYLDKFVKATEKFFEVRDVNRKIFLTRKKNRLRYIENIDEIELEISKFGFEIIDADDITIEKQITIFSGVRYLIGIHGAGMINMIFRNNKPLTIIEIFPPVTTDYLPYHYIMLSKLFGFDYSYIVGKKEVNKFSGGFRVDILELNEKIRKIL
jgi:capsular polysaccharide biosynthesis protein